MKTVFTYLFLFIVGFSILIAADLIAGLRLNEAVNVLVHSLAIKTPVEYMLIPLSLFVPLIPPIFDFMKRKAKSKSE